MEKFLLVIRYLLSVFLSKRVWVKNITTKIIIWNTTLQMWRRYLAKWVGIFSSTLLPKLKGGPTKRVKAHRQGPILFHQRIRNSSKPNSRSLLASKSTITTKTTESILSSKAIESRLWRERERENWATMAGGMEANKNRFIEEWGAARENLEYNFRWTRRNLALVGIFGIAIPVFIYKGIVKEFVISYSFLLDLSIWFILMCCVEEDQSFVVMP